MLRKKKGFTLVEVLVAVLIIAVLAALLFPILGAAKKGAKKTETSVKLSQVAKAVQIYRSDNDDILPPSLKRLGLPPETLRCSRSGHEFYYPLSTIKLNKTGKPVDAPEFNESSNALLKAFFWFDYDCRLGCEDRTNVVQGVAYVYAIPAPREVPSSPFVYKVLGARMDGSVGMFPQTEDWERRHISGGEGNNE